jgi:hypothetical protein
MSAPTPALPTTASPQPTQPPSLPRADIAVAAISSLRGRSVVLAAAAIGTGTLLAALASALIPELGPASHPHPTLHGTQGEAAGIFVGNARLLALPFILVVGRWPTGRVTRPAGDLLVAGLLIANAVSVGLALGRYPTALAPYLPHLPLEDGALALAASAWLEHRTTNPPGRKLLRRALLTLALVAAAALLETYAVPHAR